MDLTLTQVQAHYERILAEFTVSQALGRQSSLKKSYDSYWAENVSAWLESRPTGGGQQVEGKR